MRLKLDKVSVSFGENVVLDNIDFEVNTKDKIAIVGRNGSGKTTLLKVITGEQDIDPDPSGSGLNKIQKTGQMVVGHLKQIAFSCENEKMIDELLKVFKPLLDLKEKIELLEKDLANNIGAQDASRYEELLLEFDRKGGYTYQKEINLALKKFGFSEEDKNKKLCEFSGGQRTKLALIKLLLSKPDVLLLDEPTNHLDITSIKWLEEYLASYEKAVIVVSHDRAFLDRFVNVVYEIERHKIKRYVGNYSKFVAKKEEDFVLAKKAYEANKAERERLQTLADRFRYKATKASMAQSKLKQIERMGVIENPLGADNKSFFALTKPAIESGNDVIEAKEIEIGYTGVLAKLSFRVQKGDRIGIVGGNGFGKSTLLKSIAGKLPLLGGKIKFGTNVDIGYFDQQVAATSNNDLTILESYQEEFPKESTEEARTRLGAFMFSGDDVMKKLCDLSGGERVRLELCKIFRRKPNLLLLDEPTNHMDIVGKESLEKMLEKYEGTLIFVSHDRYFVRKLANSLIVFDNFGAEVLKNTTYLEYENRVVDKPLVLPLKQEDKIVEVKEPKVNTYLLNKEKAKRDNKRKKLETKIALLEAEINSLQKEFSREDIASDYHKLMEIQAEIDCKKAEIDTLTEEWLMLEE